MPIHLVFLGKFTEKYFKRFYLLKIQFQLLDRHFMNLLPYWIGKPKSFRLQQNHLDYNLVHLHWLRLSFLTDYKSILPQRLKLSSLHWLRFSSLTNYKSVLRQRLKLSYPHRSQLSFLYKSKWSLTIKINTKLAQFYKNLQLNMLVGPKQRRRSTIPSHLSP